MIIETIHQDNTQIDYEKYYRNAVPWLLRFPMDISLRVLGIRSYESLLDRKAINIDQYDIGLNPESTKDALVFALTAFPKFVALNVVILLFKWVDLNHVKYKSNSNELISSDILDSLRVEFENTSDLFFFGRNVNRRARKHIRVIDERNEGQMNFQNINNYIQVNNINLTYIDISDYNTEFVKTDTEKDELSEKERYLITKKFIVRSDYSIEQFQKFGTALSELEIISEEDKSEFVHLFQIDGKRTVYTSYKRIKWRKQDQALVYTFVVLFAKGILHKNDFDLVQSRLKTFFISRRNTAFTNLSTALERIPTKMSELREHAASHSRPIYRSILEAIDSSFEEN